MFAAAALGLPRVDLLRQLAVDLERAGISGANVPSLAVPANAFSNGKGEPVIPEMLVRTQHAECPDAQCPRAKLENVGYVAKGYNVFFGNPMTTKAGVDPGFTDRAGGLIWKLQYDANEETTDGRFQVPDHIILEHNVGCSLSMTTEASSSLKDLQEEYKSHVNVKGSASGLAFSGAFSADSEWQGFAKQSFQETTTSVTSSADCVVYHAKVPEFSQWPKLTDNFLQGVRMLVDGPSVYDALTSLGTRRGG